MKQRIVIKNFISTSQHKLNIGDIINIKCSASMTSICIVNNEIVVLTNSEIRDNTSLS